MYGIFLNLQLIFNCYSPPLKKGRIKMLDIIMKRRSIRKYTDQEVAGEQIERLLDAAMAAPSARNLKPWHFIVIKEREMLLEIAKVHPYAQMLKGASLAIVVCGDSKLQEIEGYIVQDCSVATQNILLASESLGLGAVWLGVYPRKERMADLRRLMVLPDSVVPISLISIGYPAERPQPHKGHDASRVHSDRW